MDGMDSVPYSEANGGYPLVPRLPWQFFAKTKLKNLPETHKTEIYQATSVAGIAISPSGPRRDACLSHHF